MTRRHAVAVATLLAVASPGRSHPDFIPNPHQTFEGFVSINAPRPDVPVGALWIQGYGPTGEAASPDNVETVRSLNGVTIDKNLQLSASAGLLSLFGIDPRLRDHFTAHFTDLTLVRVKDPSKLSGPAGEPRILEALKAGGITISSDSGGRTEWANHQCRGRQDQRSDRQQSRAHVQHRWARSVYRDQGRDA